MLMVPRLFAFISFIVTLLLIHLLSCFSTSSPLQSNFTFDPPQKIPITTIPLVTKVTAPKKRTLSPPPPRSTRSLRITRNSLRTMSDARTSDSHPSNPDCYYCRQPYARGKMCKNCFEHSVLRSWT